jgi:lipooligosaccharide transport system permease protein
MGLLFTKVWLRNAKVWRKYMRASIIGNLGQPFLFLLAMGYGLGKTVPEIEGLTYLQFIAPGLVASAVMYSAAFETTYGSYTRLSTQRTYEAILMTPVSVEELAVGEVVWGATKGLISGLIMMAALPLFGVTPSVWIAALVPILFLEGIFFAAMGLIMTALAGNYEFFNYFTSLLITPLFLFSGIFFPLSSLNAAAQKILATLPLTHVVSLSRMLCYGRIEGSWTLSLVVTIVLSLASLWIATVLIRRRLIQ